MSDDVKVKFGGDFSDVAKGAGEAVNKAGASLTAWFNDFSKSTEASVLSALSLSSIFGKVVEGMSGALKTAKNLDTAFQRFGTGGSARDFQVLARYGEEVGVSIEAVGRTMNYFQKVQEAAKKGNESHIASLKSLGFTTNEINGGNISSIEVLRRLSDMYDKTGNAALVGQRAVQLFGVQGEQLAGIYKNGKIALDEFNKTVVTVSEDSNRRLANTQRNIDQLKRGGEGIFQSIGSFLGGVSKSIEVKGVTAAVFGGGLTAGGTEEQRGKSIANQIISDYGKNADDLRLAIEGLQSVIDLVPKGTEEAKVASAAIAQITQFMQSDAAKAAAEAAKKKEGPPLLENIKAMAVSSLQSIGGGDVASVLSGTYQTSMLSAAQDTAKNTSTLVDTAKAVPVTKPASVAK